MWLNNGYGVIGLDFVIIVYCVDKWFGNVFWWCFVVGVIGEWLID